MVYFVALASAFLVLSAATALRPGRRGLSAVLAYPVGWAAGEFPVHNEDRNCTGYCPYSTVCRVNQVRSVEQERQKTWKLTPP